MSDFSVDLRLLADTYPVGDLELSRVLLMNDARFPWLILVPRRAAMRDLIDLAVDEQHVLLHEIGRCAQTLRDMDKPDKLNIATLGNVVAQLHVHVIARTVHDAAWPRPVWGVGERVSYAASALQVRLSGLRAALRIQVTQ
jgi:diadenosine tetraphosphate (Ap4A) HIT family hydrolase